MNKKVNTLICFRVVSSNLYSISTSVNEDVHSSVKDIARLLTLAGIMFYSMPYERFVLFPAVWWNGH